MTELTLTSDRGYEIANGVFFVIIAATIFFIGIFSVLPTLVYLLSEGAAQAGQLVAMSGSILLNNLFGSPIPTLLVLILLMAISGYFANLSIANLRGEKVKVTAESS